MGLRDGHSSSSSISSTLLEFLHLQYLLILSRSISDHHLTILQFSISHDPKDNFATCLMLMHVAHYNTISLIIQSVSIHPKNSVIMSGLNRIALYFI